MLAPVRDGQMAPLRAFLAGCCAPGKPGHADPANPDINFAALPMLHNIRAFIGEDPSLGDRAFHPRSLNTLFGSGAWPVERVSLGLLGCCDGDVDAFLVALAAGCDGWLAALFAHCEGFGAGDDVLAFMRAHSVKSLERNILGFVGIAPINETLIGSVDSLGPEGVAQWKSKLRTLGTQAQ